MGAHGHKLTLAKLNHKFLSVKRLMHSNYLKIVNK